MDGREEQNPWQQNLKNNTHVHGLPSSNFKYVAWAASDKHKELTINYIIFLAIKYITLLVILHPDFFRKYVSLSFHRFKTRKIQTS